MYFEVCICYIVRQGRNYIPRMLNLHEYDAALEEFVIHFAAHLQPATRCGYHCLPPVASLAALLGTTFGLTGWR